MKYSFRRSLSTGIAIVFFMAACTSPGKQTSSNVSAFPKADEHSSQSALDWKGTYHGILPCADCEGIETVISLNEDKTFHFSQKYLGNESKSINTSGTFTWTRDGNSIILGKGDANQFLQVGENQLFWLDKNGNRITGDLAEQYRLQKNKDNDILEKYWKLVSLRGKPITTAGKREAHIILKQENNKLIGHGGCNALTGSYSLAPQNRVRFTQISSTEMVCEALTTEQELIQALRTTDSYSIKEDTLLLYKGRMAPLARFEAVYLH